MHVLLNICGWGGGVSGKAAYDFLRVIYSCANAL